eukprot:COSAG02_NODE_19377_length_885_cov_0.693384_1_plen_77_part_00
MDELEPTVEDLGMGWSGSRSRTALCFTRASLRSNSGRNQIDLYYLIFKLIEDYDVLSHTVSFDVVYEIGYMLHPRL